ncbi:MAG TPA: neocarzinostatin apoprotein domain-containing protein [Acidimicrobiales bacterium]|nr:neocarzinostatin apoprotein domain-containing protein [Acidimicrobiales bacterium]
MLALLGSLVGPAPAGAAAAGVAAPGAALTVTPSTNLIDNQTVSIVITGAGGGSTYVAVECDPTAFTLLAKGQSPADGCEARHNAVITVDTGGTAAATLQPQAILTTSLGSADCRQVQCFIAVESLYSTGGPSLLLEDINYAASACSAVGSCTSPDDSWDPSLGAPVLGAARGQTATGAAARPRQKPKFGVGRSSRLATPGRPATVPLTAGSAGDLSGSGTVTGPYLSTFPAPMVPATPVTGEGLLRLALSAPHTSWGAAQPSSTVVDVTLTDVSTATTVGTLQFVLYAGAHPFTYGAFTGPVTTADSYRATVSAEGPHADGGLSWPSGPSPPSARVVDSQLEVVDPTNPRFLAMAYAPVMYGRSTSALHDVPLLIDATATPIGGGSTRLSYTVIWSHEDAGTGFVPFLEWGTWGRMTDIENAISFTVAADGSTSGASYLWGGEPSTGFPDSQGAIQEVDVPFAGQWDGHHPILRDATGNNDFSDAGTTPFRFQLAPVPGPGSGQSREAVMDANPFTYKVSGEEVTRWYGDVSKDPRSPEPGDARQYATVDLSTSGTAVTSVAVELQLSGGSTWYASDFHTGYPAHGVGHVRTVVKLPSDWQSRSVTGARVQVYPPTAAPSVVVDSLVVLALQRDWSLTTEPIPTPGVVGGVTAVPAALKLTVTSGDRQYVGPAGHVAPLQARVTDSLGHAQTGVAVTFSAGTSGLIFTECSCSSVTSTSDAGGEASSGPATAPMRNHAVVITASSIDPATRAATFRLAVG